MVIYTTTAGEPFTTSSRDIFCADIQHGRIIPAADID